MNGYSINDLERLSGIKAHTIRIWEKRYGLLDPDRTESNIRYYNNAQLKKLLNIAILVNHGFKISHVADFSEAAISTHIKGLLDKLPEGSNRNDIYINELLLCTLKYDEAGFEKLFNTCVLKLGFSITIEQVLYPLLYRVGVLWLSNDLNPAQEHFVSNIARKKLFNAIDSIAIPEKSKKKAILFLPEHEEHEIGLLYSNYLLLKAGVKTYYMGQRLPFENLVNAAAIIEPTHLLLFFIRTIPITEAKEYIKQISARFRQQQVLICSNPIFFNELKLPSNIIPIRDIEAIKAYFH